MISHLILQDGRIESRKVPIPPNRYAPLKNSWMKIFTPIVEQLHLQTRFNLKTRNVEIRVCTIFRSNTYADPMPCHF